MAKITVRDIALVTVMTAAVCALTFVVKVPIPATGGYIHLGDVAANFGALAFGPWLGFLIAGGGMAIADLLAGVTLALLLARLSFTGCRPWSLRTLGETASHGSCSWQPSPAG